MAQVPSIEPDIDIAGVQKIFIELMYQHKINYQLSNLHGKKKL